MKRYALWALVASVLVGAGLGCVQILAAEPNDPPQQVMFSALAIAHSSLLSMACGAGLRGGRQSAVARVGVVLSLVTAPALLVGIWGEITSPAFWRVFGTVETFAVGIAYATLLRLTTLRPGRRWLIPATEVGVAGFAFAMLLGVVWTVIPERDIGRPLGVLLVLTATGTLLVWGFHLSDRAFRAASSIPSATPAPRHCVACGSASIATSLQGVHCHDCHAAFRVEMQSSLSG